MQVEGVEVEVEPAAAASEAGDEVVVDTTTTTEFLQADHRRCLLLLDSLRWVV